MPRYDRGVVQRYASKKRKKRTVQPASTVAQPPRATRDHVEETDQPAATGTETRPAASFSRSAGVSRQRPQERRSFSSYADEYRYVLADLRRVVLVAGSLLAGLIVLSLFVR